VKVTVTIDQELVKWIDGEVEKRVFRNRSHGFEVALAKFKEEKKE
jgi:metal-responsive CopG/Arc/MetJ family transcriptional regulator